MYPLRSLGYLPQGTQGATGDPETPGLQQLCKTTD